MKTGLGVVEHDYISLKYITLIALESILKRISLKDMILYSAHNNLGVSSDLFCHSVCFNLFSEWGVGKNLEELIKDAFNASDIVPEKYRDNIFYKEVVTISSDIVSLLRSDERIYEWSYKYATNSFLKKDDINFDRFLRLFPLIDVEYVEEGYCPTENSPISNIDDPETSRMSVSENSTMSMSENSSATSEEISMSLSEETSEEKPCLCNFCVEFGKYCYPKTQNVEEIIANVVKNLTEN